MSVGSCSAHELPSMLSNMQVNGLPPACTHKSWHLCNIIDHDCECGVQAATEVSVLVFVECRLATGADGRGNSVAVMVYEDMRVIVVHISATLIVVHI